MPAVFHMKEHYARLTSETKALGNERDRPHELVPVRNLGGLMKAAYTPSLARVP
jgi:hypothetical protein